MSNATPFGELLRHVRQRARLTHDVPATLRAHPTHLVCPAVMQTKHVCFKRRGKQPARLHLPAALCASTIEARRPLSISQRRAAHSDSLCHYGTPVRLRSMPMSELVAER